MYFRALTLTSTFGSAISVWNLNIIFIDYELSLHAYTKRPTSPINTGNDANRSLHKAYTEPTQSLHEINSKFKIS